MLSEWTTLLQAPLVTGDIGGRTYVRVVRKELLHMHDIQHSLRLVDCELLLITTNGSMTPANFHISQSLPAFA